MEQIGLLCGRKQRNITVTKEMKTAFRVLAKCLIIVLFAFLYQAGGSAAFGGMKWIRRFLAPSVLVGSMWLFTKDWRRIIPLPFMFASLSMGYGSTDLWQKVLKRSLYGLTNGLSFNMGNIWVAIADNIKRLWWIIGLHMAGCIIGAVVLGVFNPYMFARTEETAFGLLFGSVLLTAEKKL